jgi:archaellum component FlaC
MTAPVQDLDKKTLTDVFYETREVRKVISANYARLVELNDTLERLEISLRGIEKNAEEINSFAKSLKNYIIVGAITFILLGIFNAIFK